MIHGSNIWTVYMIYYLPQLENRKEIHIILGSTGNNYILGYKMCAKMYLNDKWVYNNC